MNCRQWIDLSWEGKQQRTPVNGVLGRLLRHHYPGMVTINKVQQAVTKWEHYSLVEHGTHANCANVVLHDFWVSTCPFTNSLLTWIRR